MKTNIRFWMYTLNGTVWYPFCSVWSSISCFRPENVGYKQWRSQVIGIGRAPAVLLTIALTTLALARTYTQWTLAGHMPGLIFFLGPVLTWVSQVIWIFILGPVLIGASVSEPHTSESNDGFFIYIYIYICRAYSVNASWTLLTRNIAHADPVRAEYRKEHVVKE